jgi:hypothetical protein
LHDQAQAHSPLINNNNANPPRHFPKSPLRHEGLLDRNLTDHSIGSDYGDRMESMHGSENCKKTHWQGDAYWFMFLCYS